MSPQKIKVLLLNREPVFHTQTWELLDLTDDINARIVRRESQMASLVMEERFDVLIFDNLDDRNVQTALDFRHHFPNVQILAINTGARPSDLISEARKRGVQIIQRTALMPLLSARLLGTTRQLAQRAAASQGMGGPMVFSLMGDMTVFRPPDVLQMLCMSGKGGRCTFASDHGRAIAYIHAGRILHAEYGDREGEPAIAEIFRWEHGRFYFDEGLTPERNTIQRSWEHVIVDSARQRDEAEILSPLDLPGGNEARPETVNQPNSPGQPVPGPLESKAARPLTSEATAAPSVPPPPPPEARIPPAPRFAVEDDEEDEREKSRDEMDLNGNGSEESSGSHPAIVTGGSTRQ